MGANQVKDGFGASAKREYQTWLIDKFFISISSKR